MAHPIIPVFGKLNQEDCRQLHREFPTSMGYRVRTCAKIEKGINKMRVSGEKVGNLIVPKTIVPIGVRGFNLTDRQLWRLIQLFTAFQIHDGFARML